MKPKVVKEIASKHYYCSWYDDMFSTHVCVWSHCMMYVYSV